MFVLRKSMTVETGHVLLSAYTRGCCNYHGHSLKISVELVGEHLNDDGMLVDFKKLKEGMTQHIHQPLDHKFICPSSYAEALVGSCPTQCADGFLVVDWNPTSENLAQWIFENMEQWISDQQELAQRHVYLNSVTVQETDGNEATFHKSERW